MKMEDFKKFRPISISLNESTEDEDSEILMYDECSVNDFR